MTIKQTIRYTSFLFIFFMYATPCSIWGSALPVEAPKVLLMYGESKSGNLSETNIKERHGVEMQVTPGADGVIDLDKVMKEGWKKYLDELTKKENLTEGDVFKYFGVSDEDAKPGGINKYLSYSVIYEIEGAVQADGITKTVSNQTELTANSFKYNKTKKKVTYHDGNNDSEVSGSLYMVMKFIEKSDNPSDRIQWNEVQLSKLIKDYNEERSSQPEKRWDWTALAIIAGLSIIFIRFWPSFSPRKQEAEKEEENIEKEED